MGNKELYKKTKWIRDYINDNPRIQSYYLQKSDWFQLCSSLDVIEDTELAIESYKESDFPTDDGIKYLYVFGLLQALSLQQDAVRNLLEALEYEINKENWKNELNELLRIKDIRIAAVGHPTKQDRNRDKKNGIQKFHQMDRNSITKNGFRLLTSYSDRRPTEFRPIDTNELLKTQLDSLKTILDSTIKYLQDKEKKHKDKFRMKKLSDIFKTNNHLFEKLMTCKDDNEGRQIGVLHLSQLTKKLEELETLLAERGEGREIHEDIDCIYEKIDYPIKKLSDYFQFKDNCIDNETAYIFKFFLRDRVRKLEEISKEIDEDYQK